MHNICIRHGDLIDDQDGYQSTNVDDDEECDEDEFTASNKRDYVCGILPIVN
jgi:hypothetical protein